ncbi:hypothetical protein V6N11_028689 [Hibiscus sabdariffa]|uniref:Uncharacterized protein n=1 Tax=Hibiscus sabdariffa TaxID=183260 RepID=A0ABR2PQI5_9ROSI
MVSQLLAHNQLQSRHSRPVRAAQATKALPFAAARVSRVLQGRRRRQLAQHDGETSSNNGVFKPQATLTYAETQGESETLQATLTCRLLSRPSVPPGKDRKIVG